MALMIQSSELEQTLKDAQANNLSGCILLSLKEGQNLQYATLNFSKGNLVEAALRDLTGEKALSAIVSSSFEKISVAPAPVAPTDSDPSLNALLGNLIKEAKPEPPSVTSPRKTKLKVNDDDDARARREALRAKLQGAVLGGSTPKARPVPPAQPTVITHGSSKRDTSVALKAPATAAGSDAKPITLAAFKNDKDLRALMAETAAAAIVETLCEADGEDTVNDIRAQLGDGKNPWMFLNRCERLLKDQFGEAKARELLQPAYRRLR